MSMIAEKIRSRASKEGISIAQLERRAGLKRGAIWSIISGKSKNPKQSTLEKISKTLGCSIEELIGISSAGKSVEGMHWNHSMFMECLSMVNYILEEKSIDSKADEVIGIAEVLYSLSIDYGTVQRDIAEFLVRKNYNK